MLVQPDFYHWVPAVFKAVSDGRPIRFGSRHPGINWQIYYRRIVLRDCQSVDAGSGS